MKTYTSSVILIAAALNAFALIPSSLAADRASATAYSVSEVNPTSRGNDTITRGASQAFVWLTMGQPFRKISPDIWLYHGFQANLDAANEEGCDTLVVTFEKDRVVDLKLVNPRAITILAANVKLNRTELYAVTK
jgi:hypothetical protein